MQPLHGAAPSLSAAMSAGTGADASEVGILLSTLQQKDQMLQRTITVNVKPTNRPDIAPFHWTIDLSKHPELLKLNYSQTFANYVLDQKVLQSLIVHNAFSGSQAVVSPVILSTHNDGYVNRADTSELASDGFAYDSGALATNIANAFAYGNDQVSVKAAYEKATIRIKEDDGRMHTLQLLGAGVSDDSDSPVDRIWNVHKAIDERVNNVVVKPGEKFSFVSTLGGPVTLDKGWKMELGLFGGGAAMTPGAGICQAATTVFRTALLAGLPILERRNHSEWVPHYAVYGAGLDATVFPGFHDLRFQNDTPDDLVFQSYINGTTVIVNVYGVPDGRTVALDGPYFNTTKSPRPAALRPVAWDEVGWVYTVKHSDGSQKTQAFIGSYYKGFPRSVKNQYAQPVGIAILHDGTPTDLRPGNQ
ncbi:MAG TPA: VanW family protein [Candidatus Peribacteraceae bacterium]|nr:VanW family protein [Candidatus Peribacteraceae bacterium]